MLEYVGLVLIGFGLWWCGLIAGANHERRRNTKEGTPSASHNSDYAAALRVYDEFRIDEGYKYWAEVHLFAEFCEQRLNAEKQHCA